MWTCRSRHWKGRPAGVRPDADAASLDDVVRGLVVAGRALHGSNLAANVAKYEAPLPLDGNKWEQVELTEDVLGRTKVREIRQCAPRPGTPGACACLNRVFAEPVSSEPSVRRECNENLDDLRERFPECPLPSGCSVDPAKEWEVFMTVRKDVANPSQLLLPPDAPLIDKSGFLMLKTALAVSDVVPRDVCDQLLHQIFQAKDAKNPNQGDIREPEHRWDTVLPVTPFNRDVIQSVLSSPAVAPVLQKFFGPVKVKLVEHSSLVSQKGAQPQGFHKDADPTEGQLDRMLSVGVALQDIEPDMGPLQVFLKDRKEMYSMVVPKGTAYFWDSQRTLHRGGGNDGKTRGIYYFTILPAGQKMGDGTTDSIRDEDKGRHVFDLAEGRWAEADGGPAPSSVAHT